MSLALQELRGYFERSLSADLALLEALVNLESCSDDKCGVDALAAFLAREFRRCGAAAAVLEVESGGNALEARWPGECPGPAVMVLGHLDTVWPAGTVARRPFRIENDKAFGPGIFDMKAGILLCLLACRAFHEEVARPGRDVVFFFTPDEETGTAHGLPLLEAAARSCDTVLCLEPPLPGGKAKTSRKGVGQFHVAVEGIAAHAGLDHERGANAIVELSRIVIQMQEMTDYGSGVTFSVGTVRGGIAVSVVPAYAEAAVDFRFVTPEQGRSLEERVRGLRPSDARCRLAVTGGIERPPLERTREVAALFEKASSIAAAVGMPFGEGSSGGGSDGSFTAAMGKPTLDGLGVDGGGAHAEDEHIVIPDIPRRAAFLCGLLRSMR
jgi:glutamate carboxypeptidase